MLSRRRDLEDSNGANKIENRSIVKKVIVKNVFRSTVCARSHLYMSCYTVLYSSCPEVLGTPDQYQIKYDQPQLARLTAINTAIHDQQLESWILVTPGIFVTPWNLATIASHVGHGQSCRLQMAILVTADCTGCSESCWMFGVTSATSYPGKSPT